MWDKENKEEKLNEIKSEEKYKKIDLKLINYLYILL